MREGVETAVQVAASRTGRRSLEFAAQFLNDADPAQNYLALEERQQVLEGELREVRRRFRRERQEVEREIVEVRDELGRLEESERQVQELVEELGNGVR